jgi:hypothetical protein
MEVVRSAAWVMFVAVAAVVFLQFVIVASFVRLLRRARPGAVDQTDRLPEAAIVLALRGAEPNLRDVIERLLDQDYPRYRVCVVVDGADDPAWQVVSEVADTALGGRLRPALLEHRSPTCSLKCSALVQAVDGLSEDVEIVAFIDADAMPHRSWLRDLVRPLADIRTGVTTGNRWYVPETRGHGSLVRHFWNAGAVVQVWLNGIPWAGSMAMRRVTLVETGVVDSWRRSLSVDGAVGRRMRAAGRQVRFVPEVMMGNREHVSRREFSSWLVRQLVAARSSGRGSFLIPLHACVMLSCLVLPPLLAVLAAIQGDARAAAAAVGAAIVYWGGGLWCAALIDHAVGDVLAGQGNARTADATASMWERLVAVVDAHVVHLGALCRAFLCRSVTWRGVEYLIRGPEDVRLTSDAPFVRGSVQSGMSIT